mmetsp:Transcript_11033/g.12409  ORF Transcript_11033/g.12409 Transcript_11033/m.12409 type:complete len:160 (+) Transcript_11033:795-1274(+)|eukprot:CAMPEP_0168325098 /NCGR_PEP_ID=MMETSP0213-20121227/4490_1 /TAXON_ID=151035 /ORGANISM="Euplotes harpa, Strain FSP1.4" /LENGTH=159 /DNA_ID=CAMNT_0008327527 /DNA_START=829 /DNA_END=1308 /DNA_ORIENTATION=+
MPGASDEMGPCIIASFKIMAEICEANDSDTEGDDSAFKIDNPNTITEIEKAKEKGMFTYISCDKRGLILCVSESGFMYFETIEDQKLKSEFKNVKLQIKFTEFYGADVMTDIWNDDTSIMLSTDQGLKYVSMKKNNKQGTSRIDTILKRKDVIDTQENY